MRIRRFNKGPPDHSSTKQQKVLLSPRTGNRLEQAESPLQHCQKNSSRLTHQAMESRLCHNNKEAAASDWHNLLIYHG